ncbi:hypothetical protein BpHYR1_015675 [Brachionus plicatilis]|uniref:Uncharacterized protein n=1 Tax=Brachionus plicatilis TaxID=10195 RepID=A0A3M7S1R5_BRAPC|nr:hypothetical protein BpHYR1_015675 [Brachionus plicatilis]
MKKKSPLITSSNKIKSNENFFIGFNLKNQCDVEMNDKMEKILNRKLSPLTQSYRSFGSYHLKKFLIQIRTKFKIALESI